MEADDSLYIHVGCLRVSTEWHDGSSYSRTWLTLATREERDLKLREDDAASTLQEDLQKNLLKQTHIRSLFEARWIRLQVMIAPFDQAIVRVYLLPDDVLRGSLDRSNPTLRKQRQALLGQLDCSKALWSGQFGTLATCENLWASAPPVKSTEMELVWEPTQANEDMSLLRLFNQIPSPQPDSNKLVNDDFARDAMVDILDSKIPGLSTPLYPYQRRSAALMLQKEASPDMVLDPRLTLKHAQDGSPWYFDHVVGTVLRNARSYEGVTGGILAEEMGAGKTIICLALILATRHLPTLPPSLYGTADVAVRSSVASLADMAASCTTRNAVPWKSYFDIYGTQLGLDYQQCVKVLERNPGFYMIPGEEPRRVGRHASAFDVPPPTKVTLSHTTLVIVPNNLLVQWKQEIQKHASALKYLALSTNKDNVMPPIEDIIKLDMLLFSQSRFEKMAAETLDPENRWPLTQVHFKRCIVDEGHKLGNSRMSSKSTMLRLLDMLHVSSRWIVTGTPSQGLFGIDLGSESAKRLQQDSTEVDETPAQLVGSPGGRTRQTNGNGQSGPDLTSAEMEKRDIVQIGAMTALYLKARPWANNSLEWGDTPADWSTYLMLAKHNPKSRGRWENLKATLDSLIIRHQLNEVGNLFPPVEEKLVVLEGSYQDQLSLNIFSMMIIFNSVQSQRTDMDYFFHPRQKKSLLQIVHNLKQTSFFGGSFFTSDEIAKSVGTAEEFLRERKVPISPEDQELLEDAIKFGHMAMMDQLRNLSNLYHEIPVYVKDFPGRAGQSWSLSGKSHSEDVACTSASHLLALQKLVYTSLKHEDQFNALLNGGLTTEGGVERNKILNAQEAQTQARPDTNPRPPSQTLAGNTRLGDDTARKTRSHGINGLKGEKGPDVEVFMGPLESTRITSTVSAKMSYLIDGIVKHQEDEKIIVFYENENVAWYLASMLDVLQIQHLIYAKTVTTDRKAQYVNTFHHNDKFRVLLMDLSQAAFGLDIKIASRIYFINPVLNPQVESQAIGRVRRISQQRPVSVETLVLRDSIDEVLLERKQHMTQAEHRRVKTILDIRPIYNWIQNAKLIPMPNDIDTESEEHVENHMRALKAPQYIFGREFGKTLHPDDGIMLDEPPTPSPQKAPEPPRGTKRRLGADPGADESSGGVVSSASTEVELRPGRRVRFAGGD